MIEPLDNFTPKKPTEAQQKCSKAVEHMRFAWQFLEDAGVGAKFSKRMADLAKDIKAALGGQEADGFDEHIPPVVKPEGVA